MPDRHVNVLVVSVDPDFRRLAAVALGRAGNAVRTTTFGASRLPRLLRRDATDVIVLEGDALAEAEGILAAHDAVVGLVHVKPEGALGVTKWGPLPALVAEVEIAADEVIAQRAARPRRGLRIVS